MSLIKFDYVVDRLFDFPEQFLKPENYGKYTCSTCSNSW